MSLNSSLIDSGCSSKVCRKKWLNYYNNSLPEGTQLVESESSKSFKFGPRSSFPSVKQVNIQITTGAMSACILTDVADWEIPLLLPKPSLQAADS